MKQLTLISILLLFGGNVFSQLLNSTRLQAFGHVDFETAIYQDTATTDFRLGEQELFINGKFTDELSFLGEITLNYSGHGNYRLNLERIRLKYNYYKNHSLLIGKFHTPVNYWNDVYFHSRLFFPTIDRPTMFKYWIPVHTTGLRLQGQNIGKYNFGYDLLWGGGMSSEDVFEYFNENSITAAVHWKPIDGMRVGIAGYMTSMADASNMAAHSHGDMHMENPYDGPLDFQMMNASFAYFGDKWEVLNEFSYNNTYTDTLGNAHNFSNYLYLGRRFKEKNVIYASNDIVMAANNDLHTYEMTFFKYAIGYKYEYSPQLNLKAQVEYYDNQMGHHDANENKLEIKVQLSYGL